MKRSSFAAGLSGLTTALLAIVLTTPAGAQTQSSQSSGGLQVGLVLAVVAATIALAFVIWMMVRANGGRTKPAPEATEQKLETSRKAIMNARTFDALCAESAHQGVAMTGATGSFAIIDGIEARSGAAFEVPKELVMSLHSNKTMATHKQISAVPVIHEDAVVGLVAAQKADADRLRSLGEYVSAAYEERKEPSRLDAAVARAGESDVDGLTGIANRRRFDQDLAKVADVDGDDGEVVPVSLAMFDIDNFSYYNDAHGKQAGNEVLRSIAGHIASNLRESDVVYRYSGVRFVALLPGANVENAYTVVERIRQAVEADSYSGEEVQPTGRVTMSVGIAAANADNTGDLVDAADVALAKAKAEGRNTVMIEADIK